MVKKDILFLLGDNVLLKPISEETTTEGSFLKANHSSLQIKKATVVKMYPPPTATSNIIIEGDIVLYSVSEAQKVEINGTNYLIIKQEGILAIL